MSAGMICYDSSGNTVFDSSIQTTRMLGTFETGTASGSKPIDDVPSGMTLWACIVDFASPTPSKGLTTPEISISGSTISWTFDYSTATEFWDLSGGVTSATVWYGIY